MVHLFQVLYFCTCMARVLASSTGSLASPASPGIPKRSKRPPRSPPGHSQLPPRAPSSLPSLYHSQSPIITSKLSLCKSRRHVLHSPAPPLMVSNRATCPSTQLQQHNWSSKSLKKQKQIRFVRRRRVENEVGRVVVESGDPGPPITPKLPAPQAAVWDKTGPIRTLPPAPSEPCSPPKCHSCSWQGSHNLRLTTAFDLRAGTNVCLMTANGGGGRKKQAKKGGKERDLS